MPLGDTFFLGNPDNPKLHLYVVISRPDADGRALCVSLSSYHGQPDTACILQAGEFGYSFLKRRTFVDYLESITVDVVTLRTNLNERRWSAGEQVPMEMVARIQDGARRSAFFPAKLMRYYDLF